MGMQLRRIGLLEQLTASATNPDSFDSVEFLLAFDDTTATTEDSNNNYPMDYGTATTTDTKQLFGQDTLELDGSAVHIDSAVDELEHLDVDHVMECWVCPTATAGGIIMAVYSGTGDDRNWWLRIDDDVGTQSGVSHGLIFRIFPDNTSSSPSVSHFSTNGLVLDAWNYVAYMREGDNHYLWVGQEGGTAHFNESSNTPDTTRPSGETAEPVYFGRTGDGLNPLDGNLSETRIVLGEAYLPKEDFLVPTEPFPRS